jgi:hypothetical protein
MIITKILGGLGNQLFQYAAAYALAAKNISVLKLDLSGFEDYRLRSFELSRFNAVCFPATDAEIKKMKPTGSIGRMRNRLSASRHKRFYKQPYFHFDADFFSLRSPVYLQGYFQSEKYFAPVAAEIRQAFTFREGLAEEIISVAAKLQKINSVSLHIRRGDYGNVEALRVHGILPISYYERAIAKIKEIHTDAQFFIFSDEPNRISEEPAIQGAEIISGRITQNHLEDFFLMSQCRHNIIANSSFSWWAAWLNNHCEKTVIAPQQWFAHGPKDTQDLLPRDWMRL